MNDAIVGIIFYRDTCGDAVSKVKDINEVRKIIKYIVSNLSWVLDGGNVALRMFDMMDPEV